MPFRRTLIGLLLLALLLPIAVCILLGLTYLLSALEDAAGAAGVRYVALGLAVVWVIDLIGLLVAQVVATLVEPDRQDEE